MKKYVWIVSKFISPYDDEREIVAVCSNKKIAQNCIKQFIKDDVSREWAFRDQSATEINYDENRTDCYNTNFITAERHDLLE